ncbi:hypothetical protein H0H81_003711 [Sphagnurus paluster]|uniref:Zn(2)-C6 fungal-type domain-containing protein n=1 Tax=Sphagnurus paluster TaxID=117069 RepID=A0A9P7GQI2_9AGAR|nr:hypothetical protein H0H81_003711 [Sphagnurus paluster]
MLSSQPAEQLWSDPNSFYGSSAASSSFSGSIFTGATDGSYSSQGTLTQSSPVIPQQSYHSEQTSSTSSDPRAKRARNSQDDAKDDEHDSAGDSKDAKASKSGACNRCKNLKVKCEFKNDTDACKRCMNGSHECFIPGRKKRRTPPKREYLLNQIRAQAAQIKELMSQLEATGGPRHHRPSSVESDTPPLLSPSTSHASFLSAEGPPATPEINSLANKAVEDWIAKAKQSFEEFDVFIGISGAGMPINYLVDEDLENSDPDLEEYVNISENDSSEYGFVVEQADGDDVMSDKGKGKRQDREHVKPANLPREAAPFGLFGDLSIKTKKRAVSVQLEGEEDKAAGIANADFFQSNTLNG